MMAPFHRFENIEYAASSGHSGLIPNFPVSALMDTIMMATIEKEKRKNSRHIIEKFEC
jgi:hypothetical protein